MCLVRCNGVQEFPIFLLLLCNLLHLLPRPASLMDLTAEEKQGRAFLG